MIIKDYTDDRGVQRRVIVKNASDSPSEGIPHDIYDRLDELYADAPERFRLTLYRKLWARGLITREDFEKPNAPVTFRRAFQSAVASEAQHAVHYVMEM